MSTGRAWTPSRRSARSRSASSRSAWSRSASSVVVATAAASASAGSASEPPHPARTIDARAAVDVSSTAAVRLHARRRSWPFTAIGARHLTSPTWRISRSSAIRSAWRTQAGIPIPRWLAPATTRLGRERRLDRPDEIEVVGPVLRERVAPPRDPHRRWLQVDREVAADLVDGRRQDRVVVEMVDAAARRARARRAGSGCRRRVAIAPISGSRTMPP